MKLELIYIEFETSLKCYIISKVKKRHIAEDILQDLFIKISSKKIKKFNLSVNDK